MGNILGIEHGKVDYKARSLRGRSFWGPIDAIEKSKTYQQLGDVSLDSVATAPERSFSGVPLIAILGCWEHEYQPSEVDIETSGRNMTVTYRDAQWDDGNFDTELRFVENPDYWLLDEIRRGSEVFTTANDAMDFVMAGTQSCANIQYQ